MLAGYLQAGEAVIMKHSVINTLKKIKQEKLPALLVNVVHDEVIFEVPDDKDLANHVKDLFCETITETGEEFNLNCPMKGDGRIGYNWYEIH